MSNGFMIFTFDWKAKYGKNIGISQATAEAGKIWATMTAAERSPYNIRAKNEKIKSGKSGRAGGQKLTCTGKSIDVVKNELLEAERKDKDMKRFIDNTVRNSIKTQELDSQSYYFLTVNYFTKRLEDGMYIPAEISVCEYSLKTGVRRTYHSLINPDFNLYGHVYEAQHISDTTHKLPLPPNALGNKYLGQIYNDILEFIRHPETGAYPPVYTWRDIMPICESVLEYLRLDSDAQKIPIHIYSIQYLFFVLKDACSDVGEVGEKPKSAYITDAYFERDFFEYQSGIGCLYHEEKDQVKYCTLSSVVRWGFMFSDYMCRDLGITLIPGKHVPKNVNLHEIVEPSTSVYNDTESYLSAGTETSYATKAVSEHQIYYENQTTQIMDVNDLDFPNLSISKKKSRGSNINKTFTSTSTADNQIKSSTAQNPTYAKEIKTLQPDLNLTTASSADINPWASRSMNVPRKPVNSRLELGQTTLEADDLSSSVASYGRGRLVLDLNNSNISGCSAGRGRLFRN